MNNNLPACDFQLAVIGGGLAGLTVAIQAADKGYSVVVFEKEEYPFHKVCGEYISMESRGFLERCGFTFSDHQLPVISRLQVSSVQGNIYDFPLAPGGFGISRYRLDHELYLVARQKGVQFFTSCRVDDVTFENDVFTLTAAGKTYTASMAAGCFGKRSNLDIRWRRPFVQPAKSRLDNWVGVKYHIRYSHPRDTIALHNFSNGYCGISGIEDGKSCLCYLTRAENLKLAGNSIQAMETSVLSRNTHLCKIFKKAEHLYAAPVTISQVSFKRKTQLVNHVIMLGDAAGLITPLCGNGMSMAMQAASLAFREIDRFLAGSITRTTMEQAYVSAWNIEFGNRTRIGRLVQSFFGGNLSTAVFLRAMHAFPALAESLIRRTHGDNF